MKTVFSIFCLFNVLFHVVHGDEFLFSSLEDGDHVEIAHLSEGCFHSIKSYFTVTNENGKYIFAQYKIDPILEFSSNENERLQLVSSTRLTLKEVAGLDGLLANYRGDPSSISTTRTEMTLKYYKGPALSSTEKLIDVSGENRIAAKVWYTKFSDLTRRVKDPSSSISPGN